MRADLMKTRQILLNLLGNAAKFTRGGSITIDVQAAEDAGNPCVVLTVTDTGVGMTEEQLSRVFDAFTQADVNTTRKYGGTGLGLAIVSRFCSLMGGHVRAERASRGVVPVSPFVYRSTWRPSSTPPPSTPHDPNPRERRCPRFSSSKTTKPAPTPWPDGSSAATTQW